jgi:hypothetical protein
MMQSKHYNLFLQPTFTGTHWVYCCSGLGFGRFPLYPASTALLVIAFAAFLAIFFCSVFAAKAIN